jgi:predicted enzyme related to lactoylglutathione lyase
MATDQKGKITGIGGIFITSSNPDQLKEWYRDKLGLPCDKWGYVFKWRDIESPYHKSYTQWSVMNRGTNYFDPAKQEFMVNYRIQNLDDYLARLQEKGAIQVGEIENYDYGRFAWILDGDGQKIELWEPVDKEFGKFLEE